MNLIIHWLEKAVDHFDFARPKKFTRNVTFCRSDVMSFLWVAPKDADQAISFVFKNEYFSSNDPFLSDFYVSPLTLAFSSPFQNLLRKFLFVIERVGITRGCWG